MLFSEPAGQRFPPSPYTGEQLVLRPEERHAAVLDVIRSARAELLVTFFRCSDLGVFDELAAALRRGVRVRLLITPHAKRWKRKLRDLHTLVDDMGAEVRRYAGPARKYHAKYLVADGARVLVGSLNFTRKCFTRTCDFLLVSGDPALVSGLQRLFEADWQQPAARLPEKPRNRLIVAPEHAREDLRQWFAGARRSVRIIDHKFDDPVLRSVLDERRRQGVEVRILGRGQVPGMVSHGKLFLVDETVAAIGSLALSPASLDMRRDVAVTMLDPHCVDRLNQFFLDAAGAQKDAAEETDEADDDEDEE